MFGNRIFTLPFIYSFPHHRFVSVTISILLLIIISSS